MPSIEESMPEGIEFAALRQAGTEDYEIISAMEDGKPVKRIYKGPRVGSSSGVIVQPKPGWAFQYDIRNLSYFPVKMLEKPAVIKATVSFSVNSSYDQEVVAKALDYLKSIPGFVDLKTE